MELDPFVLSVIVAVVVVLATALFFILKSFRSKGDTVLICGLSDSGKTHIFSKMANKDASVILYTSVQENVFEWKIGKRVIKVVDFPGAERLRKRLADKYFKKEYASLKGILFVVDSATFGKRARDVAEFLYDVALESRKIRLCIACNKQDISLAKSSEAIRSTLEKEIGLINKSRAAALTSTDGTSVKKILTNSGDQFSWEDLPTKMDFIECSTTAGSNVELDSVRQWVKQ